MSGAAGWFPARMTVDEFQEWSAPAGLEDRRWHLVDGEPVCMAPASENHGAIQSEAAFLLIAHLRVHRPGCRVITAPGVIPHARSRMNERIPDLGVTCAPPAGGAAITSPVLLIEILSPSNETATRANVWTYTTIPSVMEILLLKSTSVAGELLRRGGDGNWPESPAMLESDAVLELDSIGFRAPIRAFYATTSLRESGRS